MKPSNRHTLRQMRPTRIMCMAFFQQPHCFAFVWARYLNETSFSNLVTVSHQKLIYFDDMTGFRRVGVACFFTTRSVIGRDERCIYRLPSVRAFYCQLHQSSFCRQFYCIVSRSKLFDYYAIIYNLRPPTRSSPPVANGCHIYTPAILFCTLVLNTAHT